MTKLITRPWLDLNRKVKAGLGYGIPTAIVATLINLALPGMGDALAPHVVALVEALLPAVSTAVPLLAAYLTREEAR